MADNPQYTIEDTIDDDFEIYCRSVKKALQELRRDFQQSDDGISVVSSKMLGRVLIAAQLWMDENSTQ